MRILIADNDIEHRGQLAKWIEELEYTPIEVMNSRDVIQHCKDKCPDLIILDSDVSGTKSIDLVKQIRQLGGHSAWNPIVLMSAKEDALEMQAGIDVGADDYFVKPVDRLKLAYKLEAAHRIEDMKDQVFSVAHELVMSNRVMEVGFTQDMMTGILDISSFHQVLEKEWKEHQASKKPLALLLINLDHFREYNDSYGSEEGDECIKKVANALKEALPKKHSILARTIGDTFAVLLPDVMQDEALQVAENLHKAIDALNIEHNRSKCGDHITACVGVATSNDDDLNKALDLMEAADYALYQAKHKGRNRVFVSNEVQV